LDRLESMSILVTAVDAGSLSAAARHLGTPLATVSRKVSELEAHLKTRLLTRSSRRLTLTDAGRNYVAACKRILEEVGEAERAASGEYSAPKGDLIITAPIVFGRLHVLPAVAEFLETYPEIDIRLVLADRAVNLLEEHVDLAVRIGELPDSSLVATRVGAIRHVVCGSPGYFAARGTPQTPDELGTYHNCVTFEALMSPDSWTFAIGRSDVSVPVHSRLVVNTAEAAIDRRSPASESRACSPIRSLPRCGRVRSPSRSTSSSRRHGPSTSSTPAGASCHSSCALFLISRRSG
jgi:DNA-binding transcriptional LysR family regulator